MPPPQTPPLDPSPDPHPPQALDLPPPLLMNITPCSLPKQCAIQQREAGGVWGKGRRGGGRSGGECLKFAGEKVWQEERHRAEVEQRDRDRGTVRAAVRR